ncbi:hypothetical protein [Pseudohongiella sp. O18]|uniref:hypothetical protein n=1 Tax=Pseudohongiella sp. O18 TaxID=2904248 RepID=UPI001F1E7B74|nr:hypothetical protein [Pseudohongiella sp. O18]
MAGDWIKFEVTTSDKPEVWAIAAMLSIDPDAVIGKLLRIWGWFDQHTENGNAPSVTKMLLDRNVGVTGFCDAVIASGWMFESDGIISLPNFDRHNGKTAKNRALTAKRVASHKQKGNAKGNASSVSGALPREEKRREDINNPLTPLQGDSADSVEKQKPKNRKPLSEIQTYIDSCRSGNRKAIPDDDPVFDYANEINLPHEFLELAWLEFRDRMLTSGKRYRDWPKAFRNYVRGGYLKLWWMDDTGCYQLTTAGRQAVLKHRKAA